MSDAPISSTGKWVTPDGRVVDSEPEEGRLLVSPGGPLSPDVQASIKAAEAAAPAAPGGEPKERAAPKAVETSDVTTKSGK